MKNYYKTILTVLGVILCIYLIFRVDFMREIIYMFLMAFIVSYSMKPLHKFIQNIGLNKKISAILLIILLCSILLIIIVFLIPSVFKEGSKLQGTIQSIEEYLNIINEKLQSMTNNKTLYNILDRIYSKGDAFIFGIINKIIKIVLSIGQYTLEAAVLPIIVYYFLSDYELIMNKVILQFPLKYRKIIKKIIVDMDKVLNRYIISQLILCLVISLATFIVLELFNINFPIILSIINGVFNIIPYFGPLLGAIPSIFIAILKSPKDGIYIAIILYIIQQIEGNILSPKITGDSVNIHPIVILILLIIGGKIGGVFGMIISVPLGVVIKTIYEDLNYFLF